MNTTTIIEPFKFQWIKDKLTVFKKEDDQAFLTIEPFKPGRDELEARELDLSDYFNIEIVPLLKDQLKMNDIQVEIFKNFLEDGNFFTNFQPGYIL